jgi:ubiquitin-activating enzyme E1
VVVVTDASLEESKRIDEICHSHQPPIAFVRVETRGVFASVFCDFGPSFTVFDVDGEHHGSILAVRKQLSHHECSQLLCSVLGT